MRIGEVRKKLLEEYGLDIQVERLRRYEQLGLLRSSREKSSGFRIFTDEEFAHLKKVVFLIEIGVKLQDLSNPEAVEKRIETVEKILNELKEKYLASPKNSR